MEENEPVLASSIDDDINDALLKFEKLLFQSQLEYYKEHNTKITKNQALEMLKLGRQFGYTDMEVLSCLTNIAPY